MTTIVEPEVPLFHSPVIAISPKQGEGKTLNTPPTQEQRTDITNRSDSIFHIDVRMLACVHGTWSKTDKTHTSLIVFHCEFNSEEDTVVRKVKIEWEFLNDPTSTAPPSNPTITARGPHIIRLYNPSEEDVHDEYGIEGGLDGEGAVVKPGLKGNWSRGKDYKKQYFAEARSGVRHASNTDHRYTKGWWIYKQNTQKGDGIPAGFRIAVLIKRDNDSPFQGVFTLSEFDGGWRHRLSTKWNDFVGQTEPNIDDPVNFNPTLQPIGGDGVDASCLGDLATDEGVDRKYASIWGVDLGK